MDDLSHVIYELYPLKIASILMESLSKLYASIIGVRLSRSKQVW